MKKSLLYLFMFICSVGLFTSCSDDDDNDVKYPIDTDLAGIYKGSLDISLAGTTIGSGIPKNITISKASDKSVNMELKDFSFMGMDLGTITLTNCFLTKEGNNYKFTGKQTLNIKEYSLTGNIDAQGNISGNNVVVNLDIAAKLGTLEQDVKVVYKGIKLNGSESSEAKITSFTFDSEIVIGHPILDEEAGTIAFMVDAEAENLKLSPVIKISDKATVTPASGVEQDFSNNKRVTYTVIAEDGTMKTYIAFIEGTRKILKCSFEKWTEDKTNDVLLPKDWWGGSADGAGLLGATLLRKETNEDGTFAAKMITFEYQEAPNMLIPKITAGSIFIGKFDMSTLFQDWDRLNCTKFGLAAETVGLRGKPIRFKGLYKYQAGAKYLDASDFNNVQELSIKDKGQIQAVLYKVAVDATGKEIVLTGHDINSSDLRVAVADITVEDQSEYTPFDIEFNYLQDYDVNAKYKFVIVCSSSKDGDTFKGAGGSTLIVDEFEVICK